MSNYGVEIIKQDGNLGTLINSPDGISGLVIYNTETLAPTKIFGVADVLEYVEKDSVEYYHVAEYFRMNKSQYPLWINFLATTPSTFSEITTLNLLSDGEIRNYGVLNIKSNFSTTQITTLQSVLDSIETLEKTPALCIYQALTSPITTTANTNLATLNADQISFVTTGSNSGLAKTIRTATNKMVGHVGNILGAKSYSKCSESIGWVAKFPISDGIENNDIVFEDATSAGSTVLLNTNLNTKNQTFKDTLYGNHFIFAEKHKHKSNFYFVKDWTCGLATGDFTSMVNSSTWNKAFRQLYTYAIDFVNAPVQIEKSTGKLDVSYITNIKQKLSIPMEFMINNSEISNYEIAIVKEQNVLATSKIAVTVSITPFGTSSKIEIKLPLGNK